ncbi:hypothetical protein HispidOSU_010377 [Sigmodon hispidus]
MVTQKRDNSFLVMVSFLMILHRHEITIPLPRVHWLSKDICEASSIACTSMSFSSLKQAEAPIKYSALTEDVLREELLLACEWLTLAATATASTEA